MFKENAKSSDFEGFINGYQARNLAEISRAISLQLSEMQARLIVIRNMVNAETPDSAISTGFGLLEEAFRDPQGTIIDRLVKVGERLSEILIRHGEQVRKNKDTYAQLKGFAAAYIEAAEECRNHRLIDAALHVAEGFPETTAEMVKLA